MRAPRCSPETGFFGALPRCTWRTVGCHGAALASPALCLRVSTCTASLARRSRSLRVARQRLRVAVNRCDSTKAAACVRAAIQPSANTRLDWLERTSATNGGQVRITLSGIGSTISHLSAALLVALFASIRVRPRQSARDAHAAAQRASRRGRVPAQAAVLVPVRHPHCTIRCSCCGPDLRSCSGELWWGTAAALLRHWRARSRP